MRLHTLQQGNEAADIAKLERLLKVIDEIIRMALRVVSFSNKERGIIGSSFEEDFLEEMESKQFCCCCVRVGGDKCCMWLHGRKMAEIIKEEEIVPASKEVEETRGGQAVIANFIYADEGNMETAIIAHHRMDTEWVLDSGASKHVGGKFCVFESYDKHPPTQKGTIQSNDGTK